MFIVSHNNQFSRFLNQKDPIIIKRLFHKYLFLLLIAISQPEDIHPVTLSQLTALPDHSNKAIVEFIASQNAQKDIKMINSFELTWDYFCKPVISEAKDAWPI